MPTALERFQDLPLLLGAALLALLVAWLPGPAEAAGAAKIAAKPSAVAPSGAMPAPPTGFGNIPFGTPKQDALKLNAGNGTFADLPDKTASFVYDTLVAGMPFQVVQNFDASGHAVDAQLTYSSAEDNAACVGRYNFVLAQLGRRYGRPSHMPTLRREDKGKTRSDSYLVEYAFANGAAISTLMKSTYALNPAPTAGKKAPPPPGSGASSAGAAPIGNGCDITLHYLPPHWAARF